MAEIILLCARQDLALGGHQEKQPSSSRGEILELVANQLIASRLESGPRNATYTYLSRHTELATTLTCRYSQEDCQSRSQTPLGERVWQHVWQRGVCVGYIPTPIRLQNSDTSRSIVDVQTHRYTVTIMAFG